MIYDKINELWDSTIEEEKSEKRLSRRNHNNLFIYYKNDKVIMPVEEINALNNKNAFFYNIIQIVMRSRCKVEKTIIITPKKAKDILIDYIKFGLIGNDVQSYMNNIEEFIQEYKSKFYNNSMCILIANEELEF